MAKAVKTNVLRHLDALKIPYETKEYPVEDEQFDGMHAAAMTGLDPNMMFKTLVLCGDGQSHLVCCLPVNRELDLKAVARVSGNKKVVMLPQKELLPLTGYIHGGCSPIGMKKPFPTYIDETAQLYDEIGVSAGCRGCQVLLDPMRLTDYVNATLCDLTE